MYRDWDVGRKSAVRFWTCKSQETLARTIPGKALESPLRPGVNATGQQCLTMASLTGASEGADECVRHDTGLFCFAEHKLSRGGAALEGCLHQQRGIRKRSLFNFDPDLGGAAGIGHGLSVKRGRTCSGEAKGQTSSGSGNSSLCYPELHGHVAIGEDGIGIQPLDLQLFHGGEHLRFRTIENLIEPPLTDRVKHKPVLFT